MNFQFEIEKLRYFLGLFWHKIDKKSSTSVADESAFLRTMMGSHTKFS